MKRLSAGAILFAIAGALLLSACQTTSGSTEIASTVVDSSFDRKGLRFRNSLGTPVTEIYYLKVFEKDGMLAFCGAAIKPENGIMFDLYDAWLANAHVFVGNRSNKIVSARFINLVDAEQNPKRALCVKSDRPANSNDLYQRIGLTGGSVTVSY